MPIRVPLLLQKAVAVIYRLDVSSTRSVDPTGEDSAGYDETFDEPIVYDTAAASPDTRTSARTEMAAIRVPCQVENYSDERLRETFTGDDPVTNLVFVFHRLDLENLSLLDSNRDVVLKKGDRIDSLERWGAAVGTTVKTFRDPGLYIYEVRSRSWGFGPDGYDLELVFTTRRRTSS